MRTTAILAASAIGASAIAGTALAHEMDTDQDGLYSLAEMQTEYADLTQDRYDALDTNQDDAIDAEELKAAIDSGKLPAME